MIKEIIVLFKEFVKIASQTQDMDSNSLTDFIGWLSRREE